MTAVDEYGPVIDDIYEYAEIQGIEIDGITQEGGAGQLEINLRHGDPIRLADDVFYFKRLIREAGAQARLLRHLHGQAHRGRAGIGDARPPFGARRAGPATSSPAPNGEETPEFLSFVGGLQRHMPAAIAVMAPYVNSYRRYVRGHAAPINLEWGRDNRTTGLRVPVSTPRRGASRTASPGWTATPYLCIAASLACGYLGMVPGHARPAPCSRATPTSPRTRFPTRSPTALDLFEERASCTRSWARTSAASTPS
jgi:glutamine synthetase